MLLIQRLKIFNGRITSRNELYFVSGVLEGTSLILVRTSKQLTFLSLIKQ